MSYIPPKIWNADTTVGGQFGSINRPTAGARHQQTLPKGDAPFQLYSLNTSNGVKVNILLEELLALAKPCHYNAYKIDIMKGDQFGSGFVNINPNSKIPALVDYTDDEPIAVFESGAILLYLAQKFDAFIPTDHKNHAACLSWLMWQMGAAPFLSGGFGHFYAYAPEPIEYAINRYAMEAKRQLDVLDKHLANNAFMAGEYSIADMAIFPLYGGLVLGDVYVSDHYDAAQFLNVQEYSHVLRWANIINDRPAVQKARNLPLQLLHSS